MDPKAKGRGVVLYVKKVLSANIYNIETSFQEAIFCKIKLRNSDSLLIGCFYRSPNSTIENFTSLTELLRSITTMSFSHKFLMGDFNIKEINWEDWSTNVGEDHIATRFLECVRDCYLFQHVKEYTRIRSNNLPAVLDLVFTNEENMISGVKYNASLGKSDHVSLLIDFKCYSEVKVEEVFKKLNFFKGKYMPMNTALQDINWDSQLQDLDLAQSWSYFAETLIELIEQEFRGRRHRTCWGKSHRSHNQNVVIK